jgi:UDP-GlcNAc:undecaprenyl-phosphate GlcNAc-1-phosphate transferase
VVAAALAGALVAFLCFNLPPASVFLGDTGSMLIGLVVGTLAIQSSLKGPATVALATPLALLTVPLLDTVAAVVRRKLTGRSIYTTDRGHLHHCCLRRGFSNRAVLLVVACCCAVTVTGALASMVLGRDAVALAGSLVVVTALVGTRLFGHSELLLLKERMIRGLISWCRPPAKGASQRIEVRLQGTAGWHWLLEAFTARASDLNLKTVRVNVNAPFIHEGYHGQWDRLDAERGDGARVWRADMPLSIAGRPGGHLHVVGYGDGEPIWKKIALLADVLEELEARFIVAVPARSPEKELPANAGALEGAPAV